MLCISAAYVLMRVRLCVCPSVTFVDHVKTNKRIYKIISPSGCLAILVFPHQTSWYYSNWYHPKGGVECKGVWTKSSAVAKRPRDASSLYSFNTKRRAQSFIISCFGFRYIPLRTIKFFSVLFSSAYSSMLQAVTNKHSLVRRRLCDLYAAWSSVTVFVTS